ncbi:MAG TPA: hypothetical protein VFD27_07380 [Chthoniobacteraceae bacterium]|jgi:hypothetical protein|nr:hypothetical protein [Chthoniobacteraceae bacterium]
MHDRLVAVLCQNWYQAVKNTYDPADPVYAALEGIPIPGDTPLPETIDIAELEQGGEDGLEVLVHYEPGSGEHATTRQVEYMVEGVDAEFGHTTALDPSGNMFGPFTVGQVVKVQTKVTNSTGSRTSAIRTITIEAPI